MKKVYGLYFIITLVFLMMLPIFIPLNNTIREEKVAIKPSYTESYTNDTWVINSEFNEPIEPPWYPIIQGDGSDVDTSTSPNQANYNILGDSYTFSNLSGVPQAGRWKNISNPIFSVKPDTYIINDQGFRVEHTWDENVNQTRNVPSARVKRDIELPINMSDYIITSASFSATFNASVVTSPEHNGIDTRNDPTTAFATGDHATFYVLLSDVAGNQEYQVAYNQTVDLGQDSGPEIDMYPDTLMNSVPQDILIAYLTSILSYDNFNFSVILGIDIYCEDNNPGYDEDRWTYLIIREVNLTFTCEKKIDQSTSCSWAQDLKQVSGSNVQITDANLNFEYKIDQNWTESSQNSQIRIFINEREFEQFPIWLIDYDDSSGFQEARLGGFDITEILLPYENFTLSIQVFLAEDFALNSNITISITEVYMSISWTETFPDPIPPSENFLFVGLFILAVIGATVLGAYLIAYQMYLKYPVPVRKVRKYRKTLSNDRAPGVGIVSQKASFSKNYHQAVKKTDKLLKGAPMNGKMMRDKLLDKKEGELPK